MLSIHTHITHIHTQEVDHYHDCLEPRMAALGYRGAFMQKPLNQDGGCGIEGGDGFERLCSLLSTDLTKVCLVENPPTSQTIQGPPPSCGRPR